MEKEELKKKIEMIKKREYSIYEIISLYELLLNKESYNSITLMVLYERVCNILKDDSIPYKSEGSIFSYLNENIEKEYDKLTLHYDLEEIREFDEVKDYTVKYNFIRKNLEDKMKDEEKNKQFNLINELIPRTYNSIIKILNSDISSERRKEIFTDVINFFYFSTKETLSKFNKEGKDFIEFLNTKSNGISNYEHIRKLGLIDEINNDEKYLEDLLSRLLTEKDFYSIEILQRSGFKFNKIYFDCKLENEAIDGKVISTAGRIFFEIENKTIQSLKPFYESPDYLEIEKNARYNNDSVIIDLVNYDELPYLLNLKNFEINKKNITLIANRIKKHQQSHGGEDYITRELILEILDEKSNEINDEKESKKIFSHLALFINKVKDEKETSKIKNLTP